MDFSNYECDGQINFFDIPKGVYRVQGKIRLIELFGGVGSQAMALRNIGADFEHYRLVEWDKYPVASYNAIHGTNFEPMDITKIHAEDLGIVDLDEYTYIMTYSFPCQDLSVAGKQAGMTKGAGTRSGLLWEVERLLDECGENLPQVLLMENVPQVHGKNNINDFNQWIEFLDSKGYTSVYCDLNAKEFDVAQSRNRCFMVSVPGEFTYEFPKGETTDKCIADYLEDEVEEKYYNESEKAQKLIQKLSQDEDLMRKERGQKIVGDLEVGGERGIVYSPFGISMCESATQYKDPNKIYEVKGWKGK